MRIKLDNTHYLNSDAFCCWVTREYTSKKTGKPVEKNVSGYLPTFEMAVENYIERKAKGSVAEDMTALRQEVEQLKEEVRGWKINLESNMQL